MRECTVYAVGYHNINVLASFDPDTLRERVSNDGFDYYICEYCNAYLCGMINGARDACGCDALQYYLEHFDCASNVYLEGNVIAPYETVIMFTAKKCAVLRQSSADPFHKFILSLASSRNGLCDYYQMCVLGLIVKNCASMLRELLRAIPDDIYANMRNDVIRFVVREGSVVILRSVLIADGAPISRGFSEEEMAHEYEDTFQTSLARIRPITYVCARWSATYPGILTSARTYCRRMILDMGALRAELVDFCLADSEFMAEIRACSKIDAWVTETAVQRRNAWCANPRIIKELNGFWRALFPDRAPVLDYVKK